MNTTTTNIEYNKWNYIGKHNILNYLREPSKTYFNIRIACF